MPDPQAQIAAAPYQIVDGLNVCDGGQCCSCDEWINKGASHIHIREEGLYHGVCSEVCAISFVTALKETP